MIAVIGDLRANAVDRAAPRAGFRMVGTLENVGYKFGRWLDTVLMQRLWVRRGVAARRAPGLTEHSATASSAATATCYASTVSAIAGIRANDIDRPPCLLSTTYLLIYVCFTVFW